MLAVINIYPIKSFKERIKLVKELKGVITIEDNYIYSIENVKGAK
ncbi:hypothetical protein [Clostridium estertheticum]|nr:hypothetical protein [Clostridium estertheticum]